MSVIRCPNDAKVYTEPLCSSYFDRQTQGVSISQCDYLPGKELISS